MSADLVKSEPLSGLDLETLVVKGDLAVLSPEAKAKHYIYVCRQLGLEPSTKPFEFLRLNGREVMYALKSCTDQLRKIYGVSLQVTKTEESEGVFYVYVRATLPNGRFDEDMGAVNIAGLKGENLANAKLKTISKGKRRATLSILGLGLLDETDVSDIPASSKFDVLQAHVVQPAAVQTVQKVLGGEVRVSVPPLPTEVTDIPAIFLNSFPELKGIHGPLATLSNEDLELVYDAFGKIKVKRKGKSTELAMQWFEAIVDQSHKLLTERGLMPSQESA